MPNRWVAEIGRYSCVLKPEIEEDSYALRRPHRLVWHNAGLLQVDWEKQKQRMQDSVSGRSAPHVEKKLLSRHHKKRTRQIFEGRWWACRQERGCTEVLLGLVRDEPCASGDRTQKRCVRGKGFTTEEPRVRKIRGRIAACITQVSI